MHGLAAEPDVRGGTNGAPDVTVTRLGNADGASAVCVPYRFTNGEGTNGQFAELLKPLNSEKTAQFLFEFTWTVQASESTTSSLIPMTRVDFDGPLGTADDETVIPLCPALEDATFDPDGAGGDDPIGPVPVVAGIAGLAAAPDQGAGIPGKQFACVVSQTIDPATTGGVIDKNKFTVTEQIYAYGDIFLRKP